jgi:branched-chain amino acid transport system ATP-binding protein
LALLEINSIIVRYGKMQALHGVSLAVEKESIIAIIGHNGGGKSTTLKSVAGLIKVQGGRITFKDREISNMPPHQVVIEGISLIPADRKLFPYLSVRDNLRMGAFSKRAWPRRDSNLEMVYSLFPKLLQLQNKESRTLSGGEQQMLIIGRALMSEPEVLLLDEPTAGLAPLLVSRVFEVIKDIRRRNVTILVAEQSAAKILGIVDMAYVMENGQIVLQGKSQDLMNNPRVIEAYLRV